VLFDKEKLKKDKKKTAISDKEILLIRFKHLLPLSIMQENI
jgi:hypothetical protein